MREEIEALLREASLVTIAFAIALGWSLFQLAHGVATFVDDLFWHVSPGTFNAGIGGLTWVVGHHIVSLDGILEGIVELLVVLAAIPFVRRRRA